MYIAKFVLYNNMEEEYIPKPIIMDTDEDFDTLVKKWLSNPPWKY